MSIIITLPYFFDGEADAITLMFQSGMERLHLRKPESSADEVRALLSGIPRCYYPRIVLHEHFELANELGLGGVHLNRRWAEVPEGWTGKVSISCHSIEELEQKKREGYRRADGTKGQFDYLSLSPIFDSISKQGYCAAFADEVLMKAHDEGIIDQRVMALGGICKDNVEKALSFGFGGVMVLGDAWRNTPGAANDTASAKKRLPIVLTIAGSDPSAGAGIQQDLKTISNCGCYAATVITAITSQNTMGVQHVMPVEARVVENQLRSVFSDLDVSAVKIGMIPDAEVARVIVKVLREEKRKRLLPVVCDPIMISTSGTRLMKEDCVDVVVNELFPMCTLVTPNLPEYEALPLHTDIGSLPASILVKGGHAEGCEMTDRLLLKDEGEVREYTSRRIETSNLHGTGCTLSSAIASGLALGKILAEAVASAKKYMDRAIEGGRDLRIGHGNGPLWYC